MKLLVSIHDVMPATLGRVENIFDRLAGAGLLPVTLLVVPGRGWRDEQLDRLRRLVARGAQLAGHGWCHEVRQVRGLKHRLHSLLISRRAAEHLALERPAILRLMLRNYRWFGRHDLPSPALYVPPAWAMGPVPRRLLDRLPFAFHETLAGVYATTSRQLLRLPMAGFEADTALRAAFVGPFNAVNAIGARTLGRPLRLGIHPFDFEMMLCRSLEDWIKRGGQALSYASLDATSNSA
jgi:predicted deacetylase